MYISLNIVISIISAITKICSCLLVKDKFSALHPLPVYIFINHYLGFVAHCISCYCVFLHNGYICAFSCVRYSSFNHSIFFCCKFNSDSLCVSFIIIRRFDLPKKIISLIIFCIMQWCFIV